MEVRHLLAVFLNCSVLEQQDNNSGQKRCLQRCLMSPLPDGECTSIHCGILSYSKKKYNNKSTTTTTKVQQHVFPCLSCTVMTTGEFVFWSSMGVAGLGRQGTEVMLFTAAVPSCGQRETRRERSPSCCTAIALTMVAASGSDQGMRKV